jgi:hypothetical protein
VVRSLKRLALFLFATAVALCLVEGALSLLGFEPGYLDAGFTHGPPFDPDVNLVVRPGFIADEEGVFKANPAFFHPSAFPEGFRSPPFVAAESGVPRILFLGDSFTWGKSAEPIDQCFVDLVGRSGYLCYNTGIPGADPAQYAFLAERYVPRLTPDCVVVMIFMGNDLNSFLRNPMRPHQSLFHQTSIGWFYAFDLDGNYMTPEQAYRFAHDLAYQYLKDGGAFSKQLFLTTRVGTLLGVGWAKLWRWYSHAGEPGTPRRVDRDYVRGALERIRTVCDRFHARMLVFLIPDHPGLENSRTSIAAQRSLFDGYPTFTPGIITASDYRELPDDHLNNAGHRLFAELILRVLAQD